jgi:hypothetical protein
LSEQPISLMVHIKFRDVEKELSGSPEEVWLLLNRFFDELLPTFETARRLTLTVDLKTLAKDSEKVLAFAEEGPYILVPRDKLTDNETLILLLLANYVGRRLGKTQADGLSKEELQAKLGKDAKITSTRLGELVKNGMVAKTAQDNYRITTFGLVQAQKDVLPRIKARTGVQADL